MKLNTINVIEMDADVILGVTSFPYDEAGNKEAKEFFAKLAKENKIADEDVAPVLASNQFENVFLTIDTYSVNIVLSASDTD
jgi:hypothetical protein